MKPLADKYRPSNLEEFIGQSHIVGKNKIITRMVKANYLSNMIFFGPSGVGKTTLANILAKTTDKSFYKINASNSSTKEIKEIIDNLNTLNNQKGIILYIDELQSFNKKQQQIMLEFIENGSIIMIASTTENPYHYIYKALLSRSNIFEFKKLTKDDIKEGILNIIKKINDDESTFDIILKDEIIDEIAIICNGDLRRALNILELLIYSKPQNKDGQIILEKKILKEYDIFKYNDFDRGGDYYYDLLSAFQKSIRGSDIDASLYYLARLIQGGDLNIICRRLLVIASEDIGLAYPNAISIVKSCVDSALMLGFPEAKIPLSQATILLAGSPKSNSSYKAIQRALDDASQKSIVDIPLHLKDAHYSGASSLKRGVSYKYPHDYKDNYIKQQYLPNEILGSKYYEGSNNKFEKNMIDYLNKIK
ncbi:replication-associated recombination protein A [Peptostreptococcaceae bacterium AGR-M142]